MKKLLKVLDGIFIRIFGISVTIIAVIFAISKVVEFRMFLDLLK